MKNSSLVTTEPTIKLQPDIALRTLEEMVDSSLRIADEVLQDEQSVRGELWLMRAASWHYIPYYFRIIYHIYQGNPLVVLFAYTHSPNERWTTIRDTESYRKIIIVADKYRSLMP